MSKLRVSREKFLEAYRYFKLIETVKLSELDLSEFFEDSPKLEEAIKRFGLTGLNNRDFITSQYAKQFGVKSKRKSKK